MSVDYHKTNIKNFEFGKIQARGKLYFVPMKYQGENFSIETSPLTTPTGIQSEDTRSWMDVELDITINDDHKRLYDMFKAIDDRCIDMTIDNMDKWFPKGTMDVNYIEDQFKSPITSGWGNEPALLRFEIQAENPEDIMDSEGNVISADDVTALSAVKVRMQLLGMWVSEKFLGCHWRAIRVVANLDHEKVGRRRSSSPRRESPLPPIVQARTRGTGARASNANAAKQIEDEQQQPQDTQQQPKRSASIQQQQQPAATTPAATQKKTTRAPPQKLAEPKRETSTREVPKEVSTAATVSATPRNAVAQRDSRDVRDSRAGGGDYKRSSDDYKRVDDKYHRSSSRRDYSDDEYSDDSDERDRRHRHRHDDSSSYHRHHHHDSRDSRDSRDYRRRDSYD